MLNLHSLYEENSATTKNDSFFSEESQRPSVSTNITASSKNEFETNSHSPNNQSELSTQKRFNQPNLSIETSEQNMLGGFMEMVNKASAFWMRKFSKVPEPLMSQPETSPFDSKSQDKTMPRSPITITSDTEENTNCEISEKDIIISEDQSLETSILSSRRSPKTRKVLYWGYEQDQTLLQLVNSLRPDWSSILVYFNDFNVSQTFLKNRYKSLLDSRNMMRSRYTHKEDLDIVRYHYKYGPRWNVIAAHLHLRSAVMIKNRFYSYIKKKQMYNSLLAEINASYNQKQDMHQNIDSLDIINAQLLGEIIPSSVDSVLQRPVNSTLIENNTLHDECNSLIYDDMPTISNYFNNNRVQFLQDENPRLSDDFDIFGFTNPFTLIAQREQLNDTTNTFLFEDKANKAFGESNFGDFMQYDQTDTDILEDWDISHTGAKKLKTELHDESANEMANYCRHILKL